MKRATVFVVALLLLAVPAPVLGAPALPDASGEDPATSSSTLSDGGVADQDPENTTRRLSVAGDVVTTHASPSPDLSEAALAADDRVEAQYLGRAAENRLAAAESSSARADIASAYLDEIAQRVDRLKSRERAAVRAYANDTISDAELLQTLARIDGRAAALDQALYTHRRMDSAVSGYDGSDRRNRLRAELTMLRSPVREQIRSAFDGSDDRENTLTYVDATRDGVVVETLHDGDYLREAIRYDNRNDNATDTFVDGTTPYEYAQTELYPWAFDNAQSIGIFPQRWNSRYRLTVTHDQGRVTAYIDGNSREAFREVQTLSVDRLPRTTATVESAEDLNVTIERTPAGGPLRFNVTDGEGTPVDATVEVNGDVVGRTGAGGELWTLQPRSDFFVTVSHEGANVTTLVDA